MENVYDLGLIFYSEEPRKVADFYQDLLGVELATVSHGPTGPHIEGKLGRSHMAVLDSTSHFPAGTLVPVFRAKDLEKTEARLQTQGIQRIHKAIDIGGGKRVISFMDSDLRPFRLIGIG